MGKSKARATTLIPLPKGQVLLPGVVLRISIAFRPDIAALLAHIYSTTNVSNSSSSILRGCLPLASPLLGLDGKQLLGDADGKLAEQARRRPQEAEVNMAT